MDVGIWQTIPQPAISRYLGLMGWDWIVLDLQHGAMNWETAYECIYAARPTGARPLIRTSIGNPGEVEKALDIGAGGVVVPMVNSLAEAQAVARAAKYPPTGVRSLGGDHYLHYGDDYFEKANDETLLLVQMEHIDAVEQAEEIMALPGVDGCFVGPVDLALSMGLSRHRSSYEQQPAYQAAMERIVTTALAAGKKPCCNTYSSEDFAAKKAAGFQALTFKSDLDLLMDRGTQLLDCLRGSTGESV